jgi:hypothetical protein
MCKFANPKRATVAGPSSYGIVRLRLLERFFRKAATTMTPAPGMTLLPPCFSQWRRPLRRRRRRQGRHHATAGRRISPAMSDLEPQVTIIPPTTMSSRKFVLTGSFATSRSPRTGKSVLPVPDQNGNTYIRRDSLDPTLNGPDVGAVLVLN